MNDEPLSISWSRLRTYEQCRHRVLRRMEGKSSPAANGRTYLPGTVADRAMRRWLESDDPQPGQMVGFVEELLDEHTGPAAEYVIKWRGDPVEDRRRVAAFVTEVVTGLEPILMRHVLPYRWHPEFRFRAPVGIPDLQGRPVQIMLNGGVDIAVVEDDDEYAIYDLKATANDAYVRGATLGQLIFYDIGIRATLGKYTKKAAFIAPATREKIVSLNITDDDRRVMMSRIVNYAHGVWRREFQPTDDDSECYFCDVRHACSKWALEPRKDAQGKNRVSFAQAARQRRTYKGEG